MSLSTHLQLAVTRYSYNERHLGLFMSLRTTRDRTETNASYASEKKNNNAHGPVFFCFESLLTLITNESNSLFCSARADKYIEIDKMQKLKCIVCHRWIFRISFF